jgi:hypothetical protein
MSDTSSGSRRSGAKSGAKPAVKPPTGAKPPPKKNAGPREVLAKKGVLANLPRTRPQRSSVRRDAARRTASAAAAKPADAPAHQKRRTTSAKAQTAPTAGGKPGPTAAAKARPAATPARKQTVAKKQPAKTKAERFQDPAPRQGFETERDPVSGPVQPPGGVDLLSSAAELIGELTKSGLSSGGRLFKDVFARLPLN